MKKFLLLGLIVTSGVQGADAESWTTRWKCKRDSSTRTMETDCNTHCNTVKMKGSPKCISEQFKKS